jgi:hypothetical protein
VGVEITNTSDRQIEVSNRSVSKVQIGKETMLKQYKYRAILRPLLTWIAVSCANSMILQLVTGNLTFASAIMQAAKEADGAFAVGGMTQEEHQDIVNEIMKKGAEFKIKHKWPLQIMSIAGWLNFGAAIGSWWLFSSFNKELEVVLNQQLLQDPIIVAPGQTIKKLVVLDNTTASNRFALSIFDARTHMVKSQFDVMI